MCQILKAEVELPRLFASRNIPDPVIVGFTLYYPVDWKYKTTTENERPDEGGYHRRNVVSKCALIKYVILRSEATKDLRTDKQSSVQRFFAFGSE